MGFSWSSYVAQSAMSAVCISGGLNLNGQLSDDQRSPEGNTAWGLATDDVVIFSRAPCIAVRHQLARLERSFVRHGIVKHAGKDVTHEKNGTAIGIDLVDGLALF